MEQSNRTVKTAGRPETGFSAVFPSSKFGKIFYFAELFVDFVNRHCPLLLVCSY